MLNTDFFLETMQADRICSRLARKQTRESCRLTQAGFEVASFISTLLYQLQVLDLPFRRIVKRQDCDIPVNYVLEGRAVDVKVVAARKLTA